MQDISDDLNQLLDNYDDIMQQSKKKDGAKNGAAPSKKNYKTEGVNDLDRGINTSVPEEDTWALSPLKNQKLNSNS